MNVQRQTRLACFAWHVSCVDQQQLTVQFDRILIDRGGNDLKVEQANNIWDAVYILPSYSDSVFK